LNESRVSRRKEEVPSGKWIQLREFFLSS